MECLSDLGQRLLGQGEIERDVLHCLQHGERFAGDALLDQGNDALAVAQGIADLLLDVGRHHAVLSNQDDYGAAAPDRCLHLLSHVGPWLMVVIEEVGLYPNRLSHRRHLLDPRLVVVAIAEEDLAGSRHPPNPDYPDGGKGSSP